MFTRIKQALSWLPCDSALSGISAASYKTAPLASVILNLFAGGRRAFTAVELYSTLITHVQVLWRDIAEVRESKHSSFGDLWNQLKEIHQHSNEITTHEICFSQESPLTKLANEIMSSLPQDPLSIAQNIKQHALFSEMTATFITTTVSVFWYRFHYSSSNEPTSSWKDSFCFFLPLLYLTTQTIIHDFFSRKLKKIIKDLERALAKLNTVESHSDFKHPLNTLIQMTREVVQGKIATLRKSRNECDFKIAELQIRETQLRDEHHFHKFAQNTRREIKKIRRSRPKPLHYLELTIKKEQFKSMYQHTSEDHINHMELNPELSEIKEKINQLKKNQMAFEKEQSALNQVDEFFARIKI